MNSEYSVCFKANLKELKANSSLPMPLGNQSDPISDGIYITLRAFCYTIPLPF